MTNSDIIPFYGSKQHEMFAIEREAMDRHGVVLDFLNRELPEGLILDVGAGSGYMASRIRGNRQVICLEPSAGMMDRNISNIWIKGSAESIPFHDDYVDAVYSTWAYFLAGVDKTRGLQEVERVLKPEGKIIIIDNAGDDEFTSFADQIIAGDEEFYREYGFQRQILESAFVFNNLEDAEKLMSFFFGAETMTGNICLEYQYRIAAYCRTGK